MVNVTFFLVVKMRCFFQVGQNWSNLPQKVIPYESGESIFLNGKNEYFCSIFEPRDPKNDQKYSVLPSKKKALSKTRTK